MLILTFYIRPYFNEHVPISTRAQPWYALACSCLWDTYMGWCKMIVLICTVQKVTIESMQYTCNWHNFQCLSKLQALHFTMCQHFMLLDFANPIVTCLYYSVYTLRLMEVAWHKLRVRKHNCSCTIRLKKYRGRWLWAVYTLIESICTVKIM